MKVALTRRAERDVREVRDWIAERSLTGARSWVASLERALQRIAKDARSFPKLRKPRLSERTCARRYSRHGAAECSARCS